MYKNGLSSYQIKKEKLKRIKKLVGNWSQIKISKEINKLCWDNHFPNNELTIPEKKMMQTLQNIWKLVKNE